MSSMKMSSSIVHEQFQPDGDYPYAVVTVNAAKSYGHLRVFERVNMNMQAGTVYALLGPSGCGKTSLLRCILAQSNLDNGFVLVFGQCTGTAGCGIPGPNVGYMSQEISVHRTLTIFEYWMYFGRLLGCTKGDINKASSSFIELLHLPSGETLNGNLSGGQLRQVAFAAALIHHPKLIILDEPTVGIDPIVKDQMWQYLQHMTKKNGASIILTTHYIEEARMADFVGLMHDKTLDIEDTPSHLLEQYNCTSLEDVFQSVCSAGHENSSGHSETAREQRVLEGKGQIVTPAFQWTVEFFIRWHIIQALVIKNFLHLIRFKGAVLLMVFLPTLLLIGTVLSHGEWFQHIELMVINEDTGTFGDQYVALLNQNFFDLSFSNSSTDLRSVQYAHTYLNIPKNFTSAMKERITNFPLTDDKTAFDSTIKVHMDPTEMQINPSATFHLLDAFFRLQSSLHNSSQFKLDNFESVISIDSGARQRIMRASGLSIVIVVMSMAIFYSVSSISCLHLITERQTGHLECLRVVGVSSAEVILSITIILIIINLFQNILLVIISSLIISNVNNQNWPLIFVLLFFHGMAGMALGFLISALFDNVITILIIQAQSMVCTAALSGYFWPIQAAPYFFQIFIRIFPHFYICDAINILFYWGKKNHNNAVALAFFFDFIWLVTVEVVAVVILMKKKK